MLINLTNHPYSSWGDAQKEAAKVYGECVDLPFPNISPEASEAEINALANDYVGIIRQTAHDADSIAVHIMGEQTFCYALISKLRRLGIPSLASCTDRDVTILPDGSKQVRFHFARFRAYYNPQTL